MTENQPHAAAAVPTPSPQKAIMHMLMGMWGAQAVATAARLGIADALANSQPQEGAALARAISAISQCDWGESSGGILKRKVS